MKEIFNEKEETRDADGLAVYYNFNNNDIRDDSGNAIELDGVDDWIELTNFAVPETFSISMWVNPSTTVGGQCFISKHTDAGANKLWFGIWNGGYDVEVGGGDENDQGTATTGYQHLVVTVKKVSSAQSLVTVYKDDTLLWQHTVDRVMGNTQGKGWVLGQDWDGTALSDFFKGDIDEVAIYDHDLSPLEIDKIYNQGVKVSPRKTTTYSYDAGGNITSKAEYPYTTGVLGTPTETYTYSYSDTNWKDKLISYNGKSITYDAIGNQLTYDGWAYTWEEGRQLSGMSKSGTSITYKYNDDGIRTQKTVNGVTTKYHLVGDEVTSETNGTDTINYTYDADGNLVSMNLNGTEYYYIYDGVGNIIGLFDSTGTQVVSYTYDTWGKLISITGSLAGTVGVKNPYRYRGGYRYDTETGLYYLQSRYYNPEQGRFINADGTFGSPGELLASNIFIYCANNPVNMDDQNGDRPVFNSIQDEQDYNDWLYNQKKEAANQLTNARMIPLGKGWSYRREKSKTDNTGETDHLQVRGPNGIEVGQNVNGKPHPSVVPSPPGWVKQKLKQREGWDWDAKNKQYQQKRFANSINLGKVVSGTFITFGEGYIVYRIVRFLPSLVPPLWPTIPANAVCP